MVARPDDKWGETPCAFVTLKDGAAVSERDLIDHRRTILAHFKCPKTVVFAELPKTSTGKVRRTLRDQQGAATDRSVDKTLLLRSQSRESAFSAPQRW